MISPLIDLFSWTTCTTALQAEAKLHFVYCKDGESQSYLSEASHHYMTVVNAA